MKKHLLFLLICIQICLNSFGQTDLIVNGDFHLTNKGWSTSGNFYYDSRFQNCKSCPGYSYLSDANGNAANNLFGYIYQPLTIPANSSSATLSFYTYIGTYDLNTAHDLFRIYFVYNGSSTYELPQLSNLDYSSGYVLRTYQVPQSLFGTPLILYFQGSTNGDGLDTKFRLDDVSLIATASSNCSYSISPTSNTTVPATGNSGNTIDVTTGSGCKWTGASNDSWITITAGSSRTGNGTCTYSVTNNSNITSRTGTITIAGKTFTVTQAGTQGGGGGGCTYSISPTSNTTVPASGTSANTVTVTAGSSCNWTARANDSWISITAGNSGTGNGPCTYSVGNNPNATSRTGTITIAGKTFTITQAGTQGGGGGGGCTYSILPSSTSPTSSSGSGSVLVTGSTGCSWIATSNNTSWLTITSGSSATGNGTVNYSYTSNSSTSSRTGTITIADKTFTVTQAGISGGKITGTVYNYSNTNATASVFPGVFVELLNSNNSVNTSGTTNSSGDFEFSNLTGSNYQVRVSNGSGVNFVTGTISGINTGQNIGILKLPAALHKQTSDASINLKNQQFDYSLGYFFTIPVSSPAFDAIFTSNYLNSTLATFNANIDKRIEALQRMLAFLNTMNLTGNNEAQMIQHTAEEIINGVEMIYSMEKFITKFNELMDKGGLNVFRWAYYKLQKEVMIGKIWIIKTTLDGAALFISDQDLRTKIRQVIDGEFEIMQKYIDDKKEFSTEILKKMMQDIIIAFVTPKIYNLYFTSPLQIKLNQSITSLGTLNFTNSTQTAVSNLNSIATNSNSSYTDSYSSMVYYDALAEGLSIGTKLYQIGSLVILNPELGAGLEFASAILKIGAYASEGISIGKGLNGIRNQKQFAVDACNASVQRFADQNGYSMFSDEPLNDSLHMYYLKEDTSIAELVNKQYSTESVLAHSSIDSAINEKVTRLIQQLKIRFAAEGNSSGIDSFNYYSGIAYSNTSLRGNLNWLLALKIGNMAKSGIDDSLLHYVAIVKTNNSFTDSILNEAGQVVNNKLTPAYFTIEKIIHPNFVDTGVIFPVSVVIKLHADTTLIGYLHLSSIGSPIDNTSKIYLPNSIDTSTFLVKAQNIDSVISLSVNIAGPNAMGVSQNFLIHSQSLHNIISISGNSKLCSGDSTMLLAHTPPGYKTIWKEENLNTFIGSGDTLIIHSGFPGVFKALYTNSFSKSFFSDNSIEITNIPTVRPTISINAISPINICEGKTVTFNSAITNAGISPAYQWYVNGIAKGSNSATYSTVPLSINSEVYCVIASREACAVPGTSNKINISVTPIPIPIPSITISQNSCTGNTTNFNSTITNGGTTPLYLWTVNGVTTGNYSSPTFTLNNTKNGDKIQCTLTSNASCVKQFRTSSLPITIDCILKPVNNIEGLEGYLVLPNPNKGNFIIKLKLTTGKNVSFNILNNLGQVVYTKSVGPLSSNQAIPISTGLLSPGTYVLKTIIDNKFFTSKIIIQ